MKRKFLIVIFVLLLLLLLGAGIGVYYIYSEYIDIDEFYDGIIINGINLSGKTKEEGKKIIQEIADDKIDNSMKLISSEDGNFYVLELNQINYRFNVDEVIEKAYSFGRTGNLLERYKKIEKIKKEPYELEIEAEYDKENIVEIANEIANNLSYEPINAQISLTEDKRFIIYDETIGKKVNSEKLAEDIENNIEILDDITILVEDDYPQYTRSDYEKINGIIGSFTTEFKNSSPGRKENIRISAEAMDGVVVHPSETVSYNQITGPRSRENGYLEAPIILNGEYVPGVGGGVCQTSTTLYNALRESGLTVVEKTRHSIPPPYVPLGDDAAVNDTGMDLKFRNDYDFPIIFTTYVDMEKVTINVHGNT